MTPSLLSLESVTVNRRGSPVIRGVSADLASGRIVAIIGPNGAGKSTLLAAIAGQLGFSGSILWNGAPVKPGEAGYMPQSSEVHTSLSVIETVLLGRYDRLGWRVSGADIAAAETALVALGLSNLAARPLDTLSGGQRQLVLMAQRMVRAPRLLILDESTSALDLCHQMRVLGHLRSYVRERNALVLIAIHDVNLAARHADNILLLAGGRLAACGTPTQVVTRRLLQEGFGIDADILQSDSGHPVLVPISPVAA